MEEEEGMVRERGDKAKQVRDESDKTMRGHRGQKTAQGQ